MLRRLVHVFLIFWIPLDDLSFLWHCRNAWPTSDLAVPKQQMSLGLQSKIGLVLELDVADQCWLGVLRD